MIHKRSRTSGGRVAAARRFLLGAVSLSVAGIILFFGGQYAAAQRVLLDGRDVSHMTRDDADAYLTERESEITARAFTLKAEDLQVELPLSQLDAHLDRERIEQEVYGIGREGTLTERISEIATVLFYGRNVPVHLQADEGKLTAVLTEFLKHYDRAPVNAYAEPTEGGIVLHEEEDGIVIDAEALRDDIRDKLAAGETGTVELTVSERREASIKKKDLKEINTVLAYYTTHFNGCDTNRSENIGIAQDRLNHTLVRAGESCSFNETVGTRTRDKGYKDAPVYFDNKLVMDAGGGVCQVSTTLFNAVLRAGLVIDGRSPHFAPAGYVPVGMDATVADNALDFIFSNPFRHAVYIYTTYTGDTATVYILGNHEDLCSVVFVTTSRKTLPHEVIRKHDPSVTADTKEQEGYDGREITIKREVYYRDGSTYTDFIVSAYEPNAEITRTAGAGSREIVQTTAPEGEANQDEMINRPHDPLAG